MRSSFIGALCLVLAGLQSQGQANHFTGKITAGDGTPVAGATVHLLNTDASVVSDEKGNFRLGVSAAGRYEIQVSAIGFRRLDTVLSMTGGERTVEFHLQTGVSGLDAVVVTAEKREELLRHVPIAVTAITDRQVSEYRLWNNKDITALVPNLYAADPGDGRDVVSIRGITTTSYDPAVTTYIDGVGQLGLDTYIPALFDVERIEVLRGPQGTLYGRNAMGGVINIVTREPGNNIDGSLELNVGNAGQQRYTAAFRAPLVKDRLFIGVAGLYEGRDGFYTNTYNGSSYDKQHGFTGNYYLRWLPGRQWSAELNVKHREVRNHGAFPLVTDPVGAFTDPYKLDQNAITPMIDNTLDGSLSVKYHGAAFNLSSQTAYQRNYRYYDQPIDGDFSPYDIVSVINNYGKQWNNVKVWTEDIRLTSPAGSNSRWKWTAGSYWFFQDQPNKQATRYGNDANAAYGIGDSLFATINTTRNHRWGLAFYGQAVYALTPHLNITAGLRYDYEHQWEDVLGEYQHDPDPTPIVIRPDTSGTVAFHALSPKLSLDYRLSGHLMTYISYSRGFRTGGLTQLSSDATQPPLAGFKPEYSSNYEAGIKGDLPGGALRGNLAVFYNHVNDAQVPTLILPDAITVTRNTGKLNSEGVEAEIEAVPFRGFTAAYQFGYTHTRYTSLNYSENGASVDLSGKHQVFSPDMTSLLALQYKHAIARGWDAVIRGEWKYIGTTYYDLGNTIKQSPYGVYNTRLGVQGTRLEIWGWMRNIGDKKYISYAYNFGAYHLGDPRTYGVTLVARLKAH